MKELQKVSFSENSSLKENNDKLNNITQFKFHLIKNGRFINDSLRFREIANEIASNIEGCVMLNLIIFI
jgi:hypothetical protein